MMILAAVSLLDAGLAVYHVVSQRRGPFGELGVPVAEAMQSTLGGASAALVQGFLLFRTSQVRESTSSRGVVFASEVLISHLVPMFSCYDDRGCGGLRSWSLGSQRSGS